MTQKMDEKRCESNFETLNGKKKDSYFALAVFPNNGTNRFVREHYNLPSRHEMWQTYTVFQQIGWFCCILAKSSGQSEGEDVHITLVLLGDMSFTSSQKQYASTYMLYSDLLAGDEHQGEKHRDEPAKTESNTCLMLLFD